MFEGFPSHWSTLKKLIWLYKGVMKAASWVWKTVSGSLLHITDAIAGDVSALSVAINPVQDLHGYDNPWPAGGGKNLCGNMSQGYWAYSNGTWTGSGVWIATYPKIKCKPNTNYVASWGNGYQTRWQGFVWYDADGNYIGTDNEQAAKTTGITATSPANAAYMIYNIAGTTSSTNIVPSDITEFQIEEGSTATTYSPYSNICPISGWTQAKIWREVTHDTSANPTLTIDLDGTIYGGTLDVLTGVLTVTHRYFVADGTTIKVTGGYGAGGPNWLPAIVLPTGQNGYGYPGIVCDKLKHVTSSAIQNTENSIAFGNTGNPIMVLHIGTMQGTDGTHGYNSTDAVKAAVNAWLSENPLQICYKLATPQTVQLTPAQLTLLAGENYVWCDTGDISLTYKAAEPNNLVGTAIVGTAKAG